MKKIFGQIVRYVSLIPILAFAVSCDEVEEGWDSPYVYVESYIPYYVNPDSLALNESWKYHSEPGIVLTIKGRDIYQNIDSDKTQYMVLAKKYGDIGFNRKAAKGREGAISLAIDSISVVSDADIDASHPKGTELSDIVKLNTRSYYLFITSGYKDTNDQYTDKDKFISEYTKEDFSLLFNKHGLGFHFDNLDEIKGTHNLTISIYFENGKKLSAIQSINFD
ncbi:MAG: hypothetical protein KIH03_08735 [Paludibacteraceae bacterium]|jgi:hypothetical protein|nr:hypothetical protein [Paludibacteraceae bacterium]